MLQTLKDKVKTQVEIHQHLVRYYDSDSDQYQEEGQVKLEDLPRSTMGKYLSSDDSDIDQHQKMNQRRKKVLENLQYASKENIESTKHQKQQRPLKKAHKMSEPEQSRQIVELKSKIAQLLKQSQQKSSQIQQLQTSLTLLNIKVDNLTCQLQEKYVNLVAKEEQIKVLKLENKNISQQYERGLKQYQKEYKRRTDSLQNEVSEINQSTIEKDKQINLLTSLVKLKDDELDQLKKNEEKAQKCISQNIKLKSDVKRLLSLLQSSVKGQTLTKSTKNVLESKVSPFKQKRQRSKSFAVNNVFNHSKIKTPKRLSQCFDVNYTSLPSKTQKHERSCSEWVPTDLINQVETFLKKWRMAQNKTKFVNSLVNFIHTYTEKCLNQNKSMMQNQYKSFKKEIQRKANQSLVFGEIMKQRQLKIKLSQSQNKESFGKSPLKGKNETKIQNLNLTSQNVSILVPASNKKVNESRKNNFLSTSLLNDKFQKDDIGYINLEKSMKIHRQNSAQIFEPHYQGKDDVIKSFILHKRSNSKDKRKHCRTQTSIKSSKKQSINSSCKKKSIQSISQKKAYDFPLKKFKII